jgi:EmrB/QacA subfamily drug resistance transporter
MTHKTDGEPDSFSVAASSGEEGVVPWSFLPRLRRRAMRAAVHGPDSPVGGDRHRWWVLVTVLAGLLAVNFTFTIFAVALGRVGHTFHTSAANVTWVITAPLLCFGVAAPALGKLGDTIGQRRLYLIGTSLTVVAALLTATAPSIGVLILARALSGIVGAATGTASMALIFRAFDQEDRVKAMGWWSLVGAGGPVIGVVAGGVLIQDFGWRALFWAQAPVILAATLLAALVLPETRRGSVESFDWSGAASITLASVGLLVGLNRGPGSGWASPLVLGSFAAVPVGLALFGRAERRAAHPILPLHLLRRRNFSFAIANQLASNFAYMGGFILTPLLLEQVFGQSAAKAGLTVIARPLAFSIVAPLAGYLAARIGSRTTAVTGGIVLVGSMVVFGLAGHTSGVPIVVAALTLSGVGLGMSSPSVAASVANAVDDDDLGSASSALQLVGQLGTVAGIQVLETVQTTRARSAGLLGSFHDAYFAGGIAAVAAAVCAVGLLARRAEAAEADRAEEAAAREDGRELSGVGLAEA